MASHDPSKYQFSTSTYIVMFTTLLTAYYMYVSCVFNSHNSDCLFQLGYLHVTEEPLQDADSGCLQLSQNFPPTSRGYHRESYLRSDRSWVATFLSPIVIIILGLCLQKPPFDEWMVEVLPQTRMCWLVAHRVARLTFDITRTTSPIGP